MATAGKNTQKHIKDVCGFKCGPAPDGIPSPSRYPQYPKYHVDPFCSVVHVIEFILRKTAKLPGWNVINPSLNWPLLLEIRADSQKTEALYDAETRYNRSLTDLQGEFVALMRIWTEHLPEGEEDGGSATVVSADTA